MTAIECANANGTSDVINLNGQTVTLTDSFANYSGNTGLPQITTSITVRNGTITRSGANEFRFFNVSNTGDAPALLAEIDVAHAQAAAAVRQWVKEHV